MQSKKVIACIDDSRYAEAICDCAAWSALRMSAPLDLLHALNQPQGESHKNLSGNIGFNAQEALLIELAELDARRAKLAMEQGKLMLAAAKKYVLAAGLEQVETRQRHGGLISILKELEHETRMLVVGKRGADTASEHGHIGSHLESIIRSLHTPILITQQIFKAPKAIMLAFDGSATTFKGVEMIATSPLFRGLPCHLVMVGKDTPDAQTQVQKAQQILLAAGFDAPTAIVSGEPKVALNDYQQLHNIDLLVMGAYGHSRIRHLFVGSTTTAMIRNTTISLLVLR